MRARLTYANVMATIAVFLALGGTTYAAARIGTKQIKNGAVTNAKLASGSVTSAKVKDRSLLAKDFRFGQLPRGPRGPVGATGPRGPRGPAGGLTGRAGGDLSGSYPNPQIRANAVGASEIASNAVGRSEVATAAVASAEIADGSIVTADLAANLIGGGQVADRSLRLADLAVASGTVAVDLPEIAAAGCQMVPITIAGTAAGDIVLLAPPATLDDALYVTTPRVAEAGSVRTTVCALPGAMPSPIDEAAAAWTFAVLRP